MPHTSQLIPDEPQPSFVYDEEDSVQLEYLSKMNKNLHSSNETATSLLPCTTISMHTANCVIYLPSEIYAIILSFGCQKLNEIANFRLVSKLWNELVLYCTHTINASIIVRVAAENNNKLLIVQQQQVHDETKATHSIEEVEPQERVMSTVAHQTIGQSTVRAPVNPFQIIPKFSQLQRLTIELVIVVPTSKHGNSSASTRYNSITNINHYCSFFFNELHSILIHYSDTLVLVNIASPLPLPLLPSSATTILTINKDNCNFKNLISNYLLEPLLQCTRLHTLELYITSTTTNATNYPMNHNSTKVRLLDFHEIVNIDTSKYNSTCIYKYSFETFLNTLSTVPLRGKVRTLKKLRFNASIHCNYTSTIHNLYRRLTDLYIPTVTSSPHHTNTAHKRNMSTFKIDVDKFNKPTTKYLQRLQQYYPMICRYSHLIESIHITRDVNCGTENNHNYYKVLLEYAKNILKGNLAPNCC